MLTGRVGVGACAGRAGQFLALAWLKSAADWARHPRGERSVGDRTHGTRPSVATHCVVLTPFFDERGAYVVSAFGEAVGYGPRAVGVTAIAPGLGEPPHGDAVVVLVHAGQVPVELGGSEVCVPGVEVYG